MATLQDLSGKSHDELQAMVLAMASKLARATAPRKLTLKVSSKGAVSVYGMGRWPVTLYKSQWDRLLDAAQEVRDFIEANDEHLKDKDGE